MTEVKTFAVNSFSDTDKFAKELEEKGFKIIATSTSLKYKCFTVVAEKKENRKVKYCYLCGASRPEFTVASKHIACMLERFKKFNSGTSHITIHICEDCFLKVFNKEYRK